jgi:hypothetical protein
MSSITEGPTRKTLASLLQPRVEIMDMTTIYDCLGHCIDVGYRNRTEQTRR